MATNWQTHVDSLVGSGQVRGACILNVKGFLVAKSNNINLHDGEGDKLIKVFTEPKTKGVTIHGVTYAIFKTDARSIYGKKGTNGCIVLKTSKSIIVGVYDSTIPQEKATLAVEGLAARLIKDGL
ncbi:hypothetical protein CYY_005538 [Polysphondylium violaceum]|uniref:Profilin n=1 Tax=Polysphondylium violaceum TaxID=133409 RepID=A0A8J4PW81_9MYCE|nr:hypothetical protein CYY_005538 [Polysphondylium violaceum]